MILLHKTDFKSLSKTKTKGQGVLLYDFPESDLTTTNQEHFHLVNNTEWSGVSSSIKTS